MIADEEFGAGTPSDVSPNDRLQMRERGVEECLTDQGQFSRVWATPEVSVFTRGPCGC